MMISSSEEKSLPQKLSEDIIAFILKENLQPGDKLPNETVLSERLKLCPRGNEASCFQKYRDDPSGIRNLYRIISGNGGRSAGINFYRQQAEADP